MDRSVLDEVIATIEPPDQAVGAAARARLDSALGESRGSLATIEALAVTLSATRRRVGPPVERKVVVAFAADLDDGVSCAEAVRDAARGDAALPVLARACGARMMLVDVGVRAEELGTGVLSLRVAAGAGEERALAALQTGIALVLSLASEGVDVLALGDLSPASRAAAAGLARTLCGALPPPPLAALARAGSLVHAAMAGACLAASAIRVPVVLDGPSAVAAALAAVRLAPDAAGHLIAAQAAGDETEAAALAALGLTPLMSRLSTRGDGSGAALALPLVETAARLPRELR